MVWRPITADHLLRLAVISVGAETLTDWYRAWVEAGHALGKLVTERDILLKRAGRGGSAAMDLDLRAALTQWISTVRAFLAILDLIEIGQDTREALLSPLEACVAQAQRHRDTPMLPVPEAPDEPGAPASDGLVSMLASTADIGIISPNLPSERDAPVTRPNQPPGSFDGLLMAGLQGTDLAVHSGFPRTPDAGKSVTIRPK